MATKKKFLAKHGLAVNTSSGSTTTLNYPTADGAANQFIKTDGSGALSFASVADNFLALSDTPASFSGNNGKGILVKADGTGLEFGGGTVVNSVNRHELSGNGSTAFTLGTTYSSGNHIFVFVDGVIQNKDVPGTSNNDYVVTVANNTIALTDASIPAGLTVITQIVF